jgi:hypothetical protein
MTDIEVLGKEPAELDYAEEEEKEEWRDQGKLNQAGPALLMGASNVFRSTCQTVGSENLHHLVIAEISRKGTSSAVKATQRRGLLALRRHLDLERVTQ